MKRKKESSVKVLQPKSRPERVGEKEFFLRTAASHILRKWWCVFHFFFKRVFWESVRACGKLTAKKHLLLLSSPMIGLPAACACLTDISLSHTHTHTHTHTYRFFLKVFLLRPVDTCPARETRLLGKVLAEPPQTLEVVEDEN